MVGKLRTRKVVVVLVIVLSDGAQSLSETEVAILLQVRGDPRAGKTWMEVSAL